MFFMYFHTSCIFYVILFICKCLNIAGMINKEYKLLIILYEKILYNILAISIIYLFVWQRELFSIFQYVISHVWNFFPSTFFYLYKILNIYKYLNTRIYGNSFPSLCIRYTCILPTNHREKRQMWQKKEKILQYCAIQKCSLNTRRKKYNKIYKSFPVDTILLPIAFYTSIYISRYTRYIFLFFFSLRSENPQLSLRKAISGIGKNPSHSFFFFACQPASDLLAV